MSRNIYLSLAVFSLLPFAGGTASAQSSFIHQAENPFDNNNDGLPDLGMAPESRAGEKQFAEVVKAFGEASMVDNGLDTGEQAKQFAFGQVRDTVSEQVNQQLESWLSPWGNASVGLQVDKEGSFTGSRGSWFIPWQDNQRFLTWSQLGLTQRDEGLVSNAGIGQRFIRDGWLLGYNTFYDNLLDENLPRGGFGAEAWGEYLRLSANYYQPFSSWQNRSSTQEQRMARGYDLTALMRLPFYEHLNTSVSVEQYFGDRVDLFHSGTGYRNPVAVNLGLSYTPVPLITVTAQHKQGESGISQNNLGLTLNYRFGVALKKQLMVSEVANSRSLGGSRYDDPQRNSVPTLEYRQRKTLSVFLTTPPWDLKPGETVALKLQVRSQYGIRHLTWQGDTKALSLTAGSHPRSAQGWTIIMPKWDSSEGATNRWRLSVVVEDEQGQRVSSNEITLSLAEPFNAVSGNDPR
ncbi:MULTISPECIES: YchO/YchP family invasin [Citrobacter]|uniref:YchO/YchP family invasin n=1 Tax=Citrobacter TaxID=544 RepID=UPI0016606B06|nr:MULTISPECIES: YchO/YchP family invasin [Citrobacter]MBA4712407.1 YchO/YchP family invasin [Citrobacter pasteurii]MBD0800609.1 YchO/YchP family invasin [Citrobacter sp. C6_1]MBD0809093.1 YchO/YchP family invasin [Citrobacter sp. C6_2]